MKAIIAGLLIAFCVAVIATCIVKHISLTQNCTGFLKRASDANTVETAKEQMNKATSYLEENNLTMGYTSVLWKTPDEDISFWYKNLKASELELSKVDSNTSQLEKTNLLMKLRETLLDNGKDGDNLTYPGGLSLYPYNGLWGALAWLTFFVIIGLCIWAYIEME